MSFFFLSPKSVNSVLNQEIYKAPSKHGVLTSQTKKWSYLVTQFLPNLTLNAVIRLALKWSPLWNGSAWTPPLNTTVRTPGCYDRTLQWSFGGCGNRDSTHSVPRHPRQCAHPNMHASPTIYSLGCRIPMLTRGSPSNFFHKIISATKQKSGSLIRSAPHHCHAFRPFYR